MSQSKEQLSYKDAGVNIDAGNALVDRIKESVKSTKRPEVQGSIGGFGALCSIPVKYKKPVLVSATDGVGTKLRLAIDSNRHNTIGQDLVAMCVNDLIVQGAEPLFFLDYYATSKLDVEVASTVVKSIADGCLLAGCALVGGETAEMPGMYHPNDYDVAGFSVGVVEEDELIDSSKIKVRDVLIALPSSGPHSNGYSLIRKVLDVNNIDLTTEMLDDKLLIDHLLEPTKIYVKTVLQLAKQVSISAIVHITGGGFWENIPRVLPENLAVEIDSSSWKWPSVFNWLQEKGNISTYEMYRTFNCGVGMIIAVAPEELDNALAILHNRNEEAFIIGEVIGKSDDSSEQVIIK